MYLSIYVIHEYAVINVTDCSQYMLRAYDDCNASEIYRVFLQYNITQITVALRYHLNAVVVGITRIILCTCCWNAIAAESEN